jgi:hypothetical protein
MRLEIENPIECNQKMFDKIQQLIFEDRRVLGISIADDLDISHVFDGSIIHEVLCFQKFSA